MLKRIGIGFILLCISLVSLIIVYTVTHGNIFIFDRLRLCAAIHNITTSYYVPNYKVIITTHLIAQHTLSAHFQMLVYISVWEFIFRQSPHSMKGLVFGVFYALQGIFRCMAVALLLVFHHLWHTPYLNCGTGFLLVIIAIGVISLFVYVCASKRYKYRMRDEPCHVRRYAEEYYSNT